MVAPSACRANRGAMEVVIVPGPAAGGELAAQKLASAHGTDFAAGFIIRSMQPADDGGPASRDGSRAHRDQCETAASRPSGLFRARTRLETGRDQSKASKSLIAVQRPYSRSRRRQRP